MNTASAGEEGIYRAMADDGGRPKLGTTATSLGVRKGKDIDPDAGGMVAPPSQQSAGKNGVSCSPKALALPRFALPALWGGPNQKTKVWKISESDLGPDLIAIRDGPQHISIAPARPMTFDEYVAAVQATVSKWVSVDLGG
jgi:hypothetical protein